MGYTHYWYRPKEIEPATFQKIVDDFKQLLPEFERIGIPLAGPTGEGEPIINYDEVAFNGSMHCGHERKEIVIPWPSANAGGVFGTDDPVSGTWFAGHTVETRVCNGDCSYESFIFERVSENGDRHIPIAPLRGFNFCKTAFRPYDLAVITFLIIAKHHMGDQLQVSSDGDEPHWRDGIMLCRMVLGYGELPFSKE